jgi:hypothetical protein
VLRVTLVAAALSAVFDATVAGQPVAPLLVDSGMSIGAGATVSTTVGEAVARAEDAVIPSRLFEERGPARRSANIAYRVFKFAYFDLPQEQVLWVINHEIFGHGARLRERFEGPIAYDIDAPVPYGSGGGATYFDFDREPTARDLLAVSAAGMEASGVAATIIGQRAFSTGCMTARDALRYLGFELDTFAYVLGTGDEPEAPGHDVSEFLRTYNEMAAADGHRLTARTLRREVLVSLANPMLGFALYGIGRYVWTGEREVPVPAIRIADLRYLPALRYRLTSYGTEWALINELAGRLPPTSIELRIGRAPGATPWAVGVGRRNVAHRHAWRVDLDVVVWRQPGIDRAPRDVSANKLRLGAQLRGRVERALLPVWFSARDASVMVEVVVKSAGDVPGEPLGGGVNVRAGIGLPLGR